MTAFQQGLNETGYIEGQSVAVEYRWSRGRVDLMPELVADLLRRGVTVIATPGQPRRDPCGESCDDGSPDRFCCRRRPCQPRSSGEPSQARRQSDGRELSQQRVGGKATWTVARTWYPGSTRVAVLVNPNTRAATESTLREVAAAAPTLGLQIQVLKASTSSEINTAFASLGRERPDALFVAVSGFFNSRRVQLISLAARHAIPATYADA